MPLARNPVTAPGDFRSFVEVSVTPSSHGKPRAYAQTTWYVHKDDLPRLRAGETLCGRLYVRRPGKVLLGACVHVEHVREIVRLHDERDARGLREYEAAHPGGW